MLTTTLFCGSLTNRAARFVCRPSRDFLGGWQAALCLGRRRRGGVVAADKLSVVS